MKFAPCLLALLLLLSACGGTIDALDTPLDTPDADTEDTNEPDTNTPDVSTPDTGTPDAGNNSPDVLEPVPDLSEDTGTDTPSPPDLPPEEDMSPDVDPEPDMDIPDMPDPEPEGPVLYPSGQVYSPITASVAANLRQIATREPGLNDQVFAKIGDSITVSRSFMHCFEDGNILWGDHADLEETRDAFAEGFSDGTTPFARESLSATVGWSAVSALRGDPSPLDEEIQSIAPRFALVMYGTNDIERRNIDEYASNMQAITDRLLEQGIIPLLSTIPPRDDNASSNAWVPRVNAVVRGIAQARQVPLMDYHLALLDLPGHGLGGDNLHPNAYRPGGACVLTAQGLEYGYNMRNLLSLRSLHRARLAVVEEVDALELAAPTLTGEGSPEAPFAVPTLPFADMRNTLDSPHRNLDRYTGCDAVQNEEGPEWLYRLNLTQATRLRIHVFDEGNVDVDLHLLRGEPGEGACVARAHQEIEADVEAGVWYVAVDTFVTGQNQELGGEYLLTILAEP